MSDRDEWGPWIEHDGKGCPCVGMQVAAVYECFPGDVDEFATLTVARGGASWFWENWLRRLPDGTLCARVIRYRIRKPRALLDLIELIESLPSPITPKVPA